MTYVVIEGEKLIGNTNELERAREHAEGIAGRRIIEFDAAGERITLKDRRGGTYCIWGREVE